MKKLTSLFVVLAFATTFTAQNLKEYNFGKSFNISYPADYTKVYDLNQVAAAQFSDEANDRYSIVLQTEKDNLAFTKVNFANIIEATDGFGNNIKTGLAEDSSLLVSKSTEIKIGAYKAAEITLQGNFINGDSGTTVPLFYYLAVVETQNYYYQLVFWCSIQDKDKNLEIYKRIAKTFKEK